MTKLLIAAGGTGGHIYPGIAIANEFRRREPGSEILFAGTPRGLESKILPREGFDLEMIKIGKDSKTIDTILSVLTEKELQAMYISLNKILGKLKEGIEV